MAVAAYQPFYISVRRVLVIGIAVLLTCVMAALVAAFGEYLTTGGREFFALQDILNHETFEVTIIAFGIGVFLTTVGFALYYRDQRLGLVRHVQYPVPVSYAASVLSNSRSNESTQEESTNAHGSAPNSQTKPRTGQPGRPASDFLPRPRASYTATRVS